MVEKEHVDDIMHYGVLGMKWGVRKGRTAQQYKEEYKKASKKAAKLDDSYNNKEQKTMKLQYKADKKLNSIFASTESKKKAMQKLQESRRETYKAARKGNRWISNMEKSFSKVDIPLASSERELGKKYIETMRIYSLR